MKTLMEIINEIRLGYETTLVEALDALSYFGSCTSRNISRLYFWGRGFILSIRKLFDDPMRAMLIVYAIVFLLVMTR